MSLYGVQHTMFRLKKDKPFAAAFKADAMAALEGLDLSADEKTALAAGDLVTLYRMGAHPLLMAPYARLMAIPRPRYQELMTPLAGLRDMSSDYSGASTKGAAA